MAYQIALDGPAGSGKSTVGKAVAAALGFTFVDTGAMYRAAALKAIRNKIAVTDEPALMKMAKTTTIALDGLNRVFLDGEEVTRLIRTPEISQATSEISTNAKVRAWMVDMQRELGRNCHVVMDGRDVGTVIFPSAFLKIYLTASVEERVRRRMVELAAKGVHMTPDQVTREVEERDFRDSHRKESPLKQAEDAHLMLTDGKTIDQITDAVIAMAKQRMAERECQQGKRPSRP